MCKISGECWFRLYEHAVLHRNPRHILCLVIFAAGVGAFGNDEGDCADGTERKSEEGYLDVGSSSSVSLCLRASVVNGFEFHQPLAYN